MGLTSLTTSDYVFCRPVSYSWPFPPLQSYIHFSLHTSLEATLFKAIFNDSRIIFTEDEKLHARLLKLEQSRPRGQYPGMLMQFKMPMKSHHHPARGTLWADILKCEASPGVQQLPSSGPI